MHATRRIRPWQASLKLIVVVNFEVIRFDASQSDASFWDIVRAIQPLAWALGYRVIGGCSFRLDNEEHWTMRGK